MSAIHFVDDIDGAMKVVTAYNTVGTPEHDRAQERKQETQNDDCVKKDRKNGMAGFSSKNGVDILAKGGGLAALDRATTLLAGHPHDSLVIENVDGYYNGLLDQLDRFITDGTETKVSLERIVVADESNGGAIAMALSLAHPIEDERDLSL